MELDGFPRGSFRYASAYCALDLWPFDPKIQSAHTLTQTHLWLKLGEIRYIRFYPNVTTLRSGLCYRQSDCLSSAVCNVDARYSGGWTCIPWPYIDLRTKFYGDHRRGTFPSVALNARGV